MKYSELHKKLKKAGCYLTGKEVADTLNGIVRLQG